MVKKSGPGELNGFLGEGSSFIGELRFDEQVRIEGYFKGKIFSENLLVVGESGKVDAEVNVGRLVVEGKVSGKISAKEKIEVIQGGEIYGEIQSPNLVINEGSVFQGKCGMGVDEKKEGTPGGGSLVRIRK